MIWLFTRATISSTTWPDASTGTTGQSDECQAKFLHRSHIGQFLGFLTNGGVRPIRHFTLSGQIGDTKATQKRDKPEEPLGPFPVGRADAYKSWPTECESRRARYGRRTEGHGR